MKHPRIYLELRLCQLIPRATVQADTSADEVYHKNMKQ
jgi:hypothetical protein